MSNGPALTFFECGERVEACASGCGRRYVATCAFELKGKKQGQKCGRKLCDKCAHRRSVKGAEIALCGPHDRLVGL